MVKLLRKGTAVILAISMAVSGITITRTQTKEVKAAPNYQLIWSDEFNGTSLDRSNWNVEVNGDGGGNNELQYYLDNTNNIHVSDGTLKITALKQNYNNKSYTSGRITTQSKRTFTYGRVEARMKLPSFAGAWPAFWMLGQSIGNEGWPACGEIDIMEAINAEDRTYGTVHWSYQGNHAESGRNISGIDRTQWHVYAVEWDANEIKWYVDNNNFFTQKIDDAAEMQEFRKEHFIIFNLAIGGNWPGFNIDDSAFPSRSTMEVDYVRVYQDAGENIGTGSTVTFNDDAVAKSTGQWVGYYGSDWANANGTYSAPGRAKDGIVMNMSSIGNTLWGTQAYLKGLSYYAGNTYKYKCTITSDVTRTILVKVAGDNDSEISGDYIQVTAGVPYYYEKDIQIAAGYNGALDLYFGLGKNDRETLSDTAACNLKINNVSFTSVVTTSYTGERPTIVTNVPATVPVNSYVSKSEQITMNSLSNGTMYAGNLSSGSSIDYYINVTESGTYNVTLRLAAGDAQYNASGIILRFNDTDVVTLPIQGSSGWETFVDHTTKIAFTQPGQYKLTLVSNGGGGACNIADFTLLKEGEVTTEPETTEPETTKEPVVKDGVYLNGANSTTATGLEGNHDFTDAYVWKGNPQYPQADNSYKYLVLTYTGDITDIRLGNDSNPPTEVYWFGAGHEDGTNHSFVTPQGTTVPANGNNTTIVIDLEKSGTAGSFFKSFHVHTGSSGKTGSLNITEAYLSQKNPLGEETTTEEPTTEKPTEAPTEKPTEEPTTEEPTTEKTYTVSVDGKTVMTAKEGETYTLPRTARVGYYAEGKMYKKGSAYTVTKDVNFSSVDLTANTGASIRLADPSGLTYKAAITCSDSSLFTSDAIVNEGMLITTNDIYSEEGSLDFTSEYTYVNIENSGWNGGVAGAFTGTIAGIRSMNYGRTYIARAYVTVKFADGTESVTYSKMTGVRSVRSVATSMKNTPSVYNGLTAAQKALIDRFIAE